jgi:hypothetical protein
MNFLIAPFLIAANCVTPTCKSPAAPQTLRNTVAVRRPPDPTVVLKFAGPTIPVAAVPSSLGWYEQRFRQYADEQWAAFGPKWDAGNSISGYERAAIYYVWWARTGNATYLDRAHQTAVEYRDKYLIPGGYAASPHWSQMESLYLDWLVFGDTKSRDAVIEVANRLVAFPQSGYFAIPQGEPRIQARVILSLWLAEKIEGKRRPMLDTAIVRTLATMNADGWAPFLSTCGGSLNYMNGMLYDVLTRIYDQRPGAYNSAILKNVKAYGNYLWTSQWRGAQDPSFNYVSLLCDGTGGPTSAPDLNGLIVPEFGWLGKTTGDQTWFDRGDQVFNGMREASAYLYRQFSESYTSSYRYLGYRYGTK